MKIGFIGGHSNKKIGAVSTIAGTNYKEHLVVRDIANKCVEYAKKNYEGTFITDDVNSHSGSGEVTFIINNKLDYFISIHLNSSSNTTANGCEIIVNCREKTVGIETEMMKRLSSEIGFKNRGVKRRQSGGDWITSTKDVDDYYGILRQPRAKGISGSILEICFISNKDDMDKLMKNTDKVVKIIVESICDGFKMKKKVINQETPQKPLESILEGEKMHRVVIGAFKNKDNAIKLKNEAISKGFNAYIVEN